MADYKMRGQRIEFEKLPLVKMPEGHLQYWVGKDTKGLPPNLPEGTEKTRPSFKRGGRVKFGTSTNCGPMCRDTKTIR